MKTSAYALPTGQIVRLHDHCASEVESYQMGDGSIVQAVRVDGEGEQAEIAAWKKAKLLRSNRGRRGPGTER